MGMKHMHQTAASPKYSARMNPPYPQALAVNILEASSWSAGGYTTVLAAVVVAEGRRRGGRSSVEEWERVMSAI